MHWKNSRPVIRRLRVLIKDSTVRNQFPEWIFPEIHGMMRGRGWGVYRWRYGWALNDSQVVLLHSLPSFLVFLCKQTSHWSPLFLPPTLPILTFSVLIVQFLSTGRPLSVSLLSFTHIPPPSFLPRGNTCRGRHFVSCLSLFDPPLNSIRLHSHLISSLLLLRALFQY